MKTANPSSRTKPSWVISDETRPPHLLFASRRTIFLSSSPLSLRVSAIVIAAARPDTPPPTITMSAADSAIFPTSPKDGRLLLNHPVFKSSCCWVLMMRIDEEESLPSFAASTFSFSPNPNQLLASFIDVFMLFLEASKWFNWVNPKMVPKLSCV